MPRQLFAFKERIRRVGIVGPVIIALTIILLIVGFLLAVLRDYSAQ